MLIGLVKGNDTLRFSYDAAGNAAAVNHNGTYYYYLRNGQGDIVKIVDGSGATVVEYSYDSWGKLLSCTGTLANTLGALNPFRYRGYVYDEETQWYYLKSRYYDPETCRFISADVLLSTGQGVLGHNCYAYCLNIPVELIDQGGSVPSYNVMIADGGGGNKNETDQLPSSILGLYLNPDDVAIAIAPDLYAYTKRTNKESMAAIYSVSLSLGKLYFAGPVLSGMHDNVVVPTLATWALDELLKHPIISLEGFVHSHPLCGCHVNDEFSGFIGDEGAAILTGCCYMIEPKNHILYKITRGNVIDSYRYGVSISDNMNVYKIHEYSSLVPYSE